MVNIRYHHCAYASKASMAQRDNRSDMGCFRHEVDKLTDFTWMV